MVAAKAQQAGAESAPKGVPVSQWSQEVALLSQVGTDVRSLIATVQSALGAKSRPTPYDGPSTVVGSAEMANRQKQHDALAARVLPKRKA